MTREERKQLERVCKQILVEKDVQKFDDLVSKLDQLLKPHISAKAPPPKRKNHK